MVCARGLLGCLERFQTFKKKLISAKIQRICLAPATTGGLVGEIATISGWGKTADNSTGAIKLSYIEVPVVDNTECQNFYGVLSVTASNICTSVASGQGTCNVI